MMKKCVECGRKMTRTTVRTADIRFVRKSFECRNPNCKFEVNKVRRANRLRAEAAEKAKKEKEEN